MPGPKKKPSSEKEIAFQVIHLDFFNPNIGETVTYSFIGPAMFETEELESFKDIDPADMITAIEIDMPYNPFEDEANRKAQKYLLEEIRARLDEKNINNPKN